MLNKQLIPFLILPVLVAMPVAYAGAPAKQPSLPLNNGPAINPVPPSPPPRVQPVIPPHVANAHVIAPVAPVNPRVPPRRGVVIGW